MTYLWIEDRRGKSGYIFWETLMKQLYPDIIVESKKNNSELVKAVKRLNDIDNKYIIVFDNSFDNQQIYQEQRLLQKYAYTKKNVILMNIICFEYILLEFDNLINWIYAPNDELLIKRAGAIAAREKLVETLRSDEVNYKELREITEYDGHTAAHNIEQLSARLLFDLTRNTGFEVSKGSIGDCWITSCCEWTDRQEDDMCGLDHRQLSVADKMRSICKGTSLKRELAGIGLEVP